MQSPGFWFMKLLIWIVFRVERHQNEVQKNCWLYLVSRIEEVSWYIKASCFLGAGDAETMLGAGT